MIPLILRDNAIGIRLSVTDTSQRVAIGGSGDSLVLCNVGEEVVYIALGGATITATTAGYPILPFTKEDDLVLDVNAAYAAAPYIAAICGSGQASTLTIHRAFR